MAGPKHKLTDKGGYEGDSLLALGLVLVVRLAAAVALAAAALGGGLSALEKWPL